MKKIITLLFTVTGISVFAQTITPILNTKSKVLAEAQTFLIKLTDSNGVPLKLGNNTTLNLKLEDKPALEYDNIELLKGLEMPNAPGFALMDEAPTSIERPSNIKEFVTNISNSFVQNKGIPDRYSVEFAPYWFRKPAKAKASDFLLVKPKYDGGGNLTGYENQPGKAARFSSFSLAYMEQYKGADSIAKYHLLSLGLRIPLVKVYTEKYNKDITKALFDVTDNLLIGAQNYNDDPVKILERLEKDKKLADAHDLLNKTMDAKPLFALDFALAASSFFKEEKFSSYQFGRAGGWLTAELSADLKPKKNAHKHYLNFLFMGKVFYDKTVYNDQMELIAKTSLDGGLKVEYEMKDKFFLGVEVLGRMSWLKNGLEKEMRAVATARYKVSDTVQILAAFGKNYNEENNVVASLGLNLGFGAKYLNMKELKTTAIN